MTPAQVAQVLSTARAWLCTPYHHRGQRRGVGCDCLTLVVAAYGAAGIIPADFEIPEYPPDFMFHSADSRYLDGVLKICDEVAAPVPGDLAMFRVGKTYSHAAIVVGWPRIVHAYAPYRRVVEMTVQEDRRLARRPVRYFSPRVGV